MSKTAVIEPKGIQVGQPGIRIIQILESGVAGLGWEAVSGAHMIQAQEF